MIKSCYNFSPYKKYSPKKHFGQNFLIDSDIVSFIVDTIAPKSCELLVEIGPGLGAITAPLIEARGDSIKPVHAVELDRDLAVYLAHRFDDRKLTLHFSNALDFDFGKLNEEKMPSLRIFGNLPYNISTPLLFHLLKFLDDVIDQHFMLQNEVVDRLVAKPGCKAYGRSSIIFQFHYYMEKLINVPPQAFKPSPKVNSAILRMRPRERSTLPEIDKTLFTSVISIAFSQRRKMLHSTLKKYQDYIDFKSIGFDLTRRAEKVTIDEYVTFTQALMKSEKMKNKQSPL